MFTVRTALEGFIAPANFSIITPLAQLVGLVPFGPTPAPQSIFPVASLSFFELSRTAAPGEPPEQAAAASAIKKVRSIATARKAAALAAAFRAEAPDRNAHLAGLVGEVGGDAGAGEDDDADRQRFEHPVVALEGRGVAVAGPVGLEDDLWNFAMVGPAGGDALGAARAAAVQQHHVGMLGADLVERLPDARVIVAVGAAGEGDAGAGGGQHFVSARRRAAMNSRLSIIATVSAR